MIVSSPEETIAYAAHLAEHLSAGDILALAGVLGAGKTHFVKGLAQGLGCCEAVSSPTFTLLQEYPGGRFPLYHADIYRLENTEELEEIGLEELFVSDGILVVEWADKFPAFFPEETRWFHFDIIDNNRREIIEK